MTRADVMHNSSQGTVTRDLCSQAGRKVGGGGEAGYRRNLLGGTHHFKMESFVSFVLFFFFLFLTCCLRLKSKDTEVRDGSGVWVNVVLTAHALFLGK